MRLQTIIFAACAILVAVAAALLFVSPLKRDAQAPAATAGHELVNTPEPASSTEATPAAAMPPASLAPAPVAGTTNAAQSPAEMHKAYIAERIDTLQDLSMENDKASLQTILSELGNPERQIRKAALEATIQFASRDAIPTLMDFAARTDDPEEKKALVEAAEFLKLPSLTEVMQARGIKPTVLHAKPAPGRPLPAFSDRTKRPAPAKQ